MNGIYIRNLKPENIKKGVEILKVKGTYEGGGPAEPVNEDITLDSSTVQQSVRAGEGYTGLGTVTVNPYTLDTKTVDPSTTAFTVNSSADGLSSVTLNAVNSSIDANITAGNIKKDVTILGVTGTYNPTGDWVIDAKKTGVMNANTKGLTTVNNGMYELFKNDAFTSVTIQDTSVLGNSTMYRTFDYCTSLTDISFPNLSVINGYHAMYEMLRHCTDLETVSFPELRSITGEGAMMYMLTNATSVESISFPKLESINSDMVFQQLFEGNVLALNGFDLEFPELRTISSNSCFVNAFISCSIRSLSFPKLESLSGGSAFGGTVANSSRCQSLSMPSLKYRDGSQNIFDVFAINNSSFNTLTASIEFFKASNTSRNEYHMSYLSNITVTVPQGYTYLNGWNNSGGTTYLNFSTDLNGGSWSDATILDILQKLGSVNDYDQVQYTVVFGNKTIQDNVDFDYTLAKNKLTDAGWTISGLTITVPDFITITTGTSLNLYNDSTIGFDALYAWTATVDDPSIHLSSASGSAGNNQTITVTMDTGWNSTATVTLSSTNGIVTQTKTVNVIYSAASYTRLEYVEVPTNVPGFYLGSHVGLNTDVVFKHRVLVSNGLTVLGYLGMDGTEYETQGWRYFYYSNTLYWDCAGRSTFRGNFGLNTSQTRNYLFKLSDGEKKIINLDTQEVGNGYRSNPWAGTNGPIGPNGPGPNDVGGENHWFCELTVYPNGYQDGAGTVGAHYIAVKDSNDVACIYDEVSHNFYYPTTGSLIPGPVAS